MRKTSEILASSLAQLNNGATWIQRTMSNVKVHGESGTIDLLKSVDQGTSFCALGAITKDGLEHGELNMHDGAIHQLSDFIRIAIEPMQMEVFKIVKVNDRAQSFAEVKTLFCTGIKNALATEAAQEQEAQQCDPLVNG